ncbi:MAG TPA: hypothetical protein VFM09_12180 [Marmoricola sp.]|nr:hypothetical protein [Marmoricola sp.]
MSASSAPARVRVPRAAWEAVERARLTVVPRGAQRAPRAPFAVLVGVLLAGGVVGLLLFNTHMQQVSFRATALQQRADALTAKEQSLSMQLAHLRDPQVLAARARKLGMVAPPEPAFIKLSDGKVVGDPLVATSADAVRISPFPAPKPARLAPRPLVVHVAAAAPATRQKTGNTASTSAKSGAPAGMKAVTNGHTSRAAGTGATH